MLSGNRQLLANFASLSSVNLINLAVPIVTIPWLLHTLGVQQYGMVALHQYMGQVVLMLVDFGFPTYCVNEVVTRTGDRMALTRFVCSVYMVKFTLAALALTVVLVLAMSPTLAGLTGLSFPMLAGFAGVGIVSSFYPNWLFQGLERIHAMIVPTALSKLLSLGLIFWLVRSPADTWAVPFSYCLAGLLLNITAFRLVRREIGRPQLLPLTDIFRLTLEAAQVFWSRLIIMIYVACSPMLVRAAAGTSGVAIYSLCEKVVSLGRMPFDMLANAAYPRLAREYSKGFARSLLCMQTCVAALAVLLIVGVMLIVHSQLRAAWASASGYMTLYLIALVPMSIHSFLGTCVLLVHGKRLQLSLSVVAGLVAYAITFSLGGWWFTDQIARVITAMVMVEFGICASRYFHSRRFELI